MRPSVDELLEGIRWSMETYVLPDLQDPLAKSTANSILLLVDHLRLRVGEEAAALATDNAEKRALFADLHGMLGVPAKFPDLAAVLAEMAAAREGPRDAALPLAQLNAENERLRAILSRFISALAAVQAEVNPDAYGAADDAVKTQLRSQLEREGRWILPAFAGKAPF